MLKSLLLLGALVGSRARVLTYVPMNALPNQQGYYLTDYVYYLSESDGAFQFNENGSFSSFNMVVNDDSYVNRSHTNEGGYQMDTNASTYFLMAYCESASSVAYSTTIGSTEGYPNGLKPWSQGNYVGGFLLNYQMVQDADTNDITFYFNCNSYYNTYAVYYNLYIDYDDTDAHIYSLGGLRSTTGNEEIDSIELELDMPFSNYTLSVTFFNYDTNNAYNNGYSNGYTSGMDAGYDIGYDGGYDNGYNVGFQAGRIEGANNTNFVTLLFTVADMPLYYIRSLFNVSLFGVKVYTVALSLLTTMVITWIIKKYVF